VHSNEATHPSDTASTIPRHDTWLMGQLMADNVYRVTEIVGSSSDGIDQAIRNAISRASSTLHNLDWFQVTEIRGYLREGDIGHVQVTLKVGFRLDEP
jgi:flavin-binding protein dodecin